MAAPDQHRFYSGLLFELDAPHNATAGLASLERLARDILRRVAPRMLIVYEVHHLFAGTFREQRTSLNLLKNPNDLFGWSVRQSATACPPSSLAYRAVFAVCRASNKMRAARQSG